MSRDFSFHDYFSPPDPLVVLKDDSDGDHRADALRRLAEPKAKGGSEAQQDTVVQILVNAASTERSALCRMAAIEAMQHFRDPRVVKGIEGAYYGAGIFTPETASIMRCVALAALGETRQPSAVDLLVKVLHEPPVSSTSSDDERQQKTNERTAAARALGHFTGTAPAEALLAIMKTEKDLALRDCAVTSLCSCTGQKFGTDVKQWDDYLHSAGKDRPIGVVEEKGFGEKVRDFVMPVDHREGETKN